MSRPMSLFPEESEDQALQSPTFERTPSSSSSRSSLSLFPEESGPDPLHTTLRVTADKQPDRAARVLQAQTRTGLPTAVIDRHLSEIETQTALKDFDPEQFRRQSPIVAQWLQEDPEHAALAKDDLPQLSAIEQLLTYGGNLARSLAATVPATGASTRRVLQAFAENILARTSVSKDAAPLVAKGMAEEAEASEGAAASVRPKASNRIEQDVYSGLESLGQIGLLAPLSMTGGEPAVLGAFGLGAFGTSYGEARSEGLSPSTSAGFAVLSGGIQVAAAALPVRGLLSEFQLHTGLARLVQRELMTAIPGMEAQTALEDLNKWAFLPANKDKTFRDYLVERPSAAADTLVSTIVSILPMAGMTRGIDRAISGKPTEQLFFERLGQAVKDSKTGQRLPPALQDLAARMTKDGPLENVYIDPEAWTTYWQSKEVDPRQVAGELLGKDLTQYDQAVANQHPIPIPTENYATKIAPTEHNQFFARELRVDPEMENAREADQLRDGDHYSDEWDTDPGQRTIEESAAKIREDIIGQLVGQGYSPEAVESHARFMEIAMRNMVGERAGLDPYEVWKNYGVMITRTLPEVLASMPRIDATDVLLDRLRSGRMPEPGEIFGVSLVDFLRQHGGVADEGGLKALDVDADRKRGEKKLVQAKGLALDRAREMAAEEGYLPKESSTADFLEKIEQEVRGQPVYAQGAEDQPALETATLMSQLSEYLQAINVDVKTTSNAEIKKKLTEAGAGPEYAQSYGAGRRGGISFGKDKEGKPVTRITLTNAANLSTLAHEFGHFYLEMFGDVAGELGKMSPEALSATQKRIVEDYQTVLKYLGVNSRSEIREPHHETWARSLEAYLTEGKAPSEELRSIFARFRSWLIQAYRLWKAGGPTQQAIGATLDVQLNPEVRGVLDRLLASDDAITRAEEQAGITTMLDDQQIRQKLGMSEVEYKSYRKLVQQAGDHARDDLDAALARQQARVHEQWWKERRAEVRSQVASEAYARKDYRALSLLQSGRLPDGSEPPEGPFRGKLDAKALEERYGKASKKPGQGSEIMNKLLSLDVYRRKNGVDPDVAAEYFGMKSGEELVNALASARPMNELIDAETDSRMRQEFGDLQLSGEISEKARQAVLGPERSNVIAAELKAIRKKQREVEPFVKGVLADQAKREREGRRILDAIPDVETVRAWAQTRVGETSIRDLKPGMFWSAARKASKLAFEHASRDRWENAYQQKLTELRNVELYAASRKALDAAEENIDEWGRMFQSDAKLSRTHDMDFVNAGRAIASTILGYPNYKEDAVKYLERVKSYDPDLYTALSDQIESVLGSGKTYKQFTIDEFNGAADVINGLFDQARRTRQLNIDGKLLEKEAIIRDLHVRISRLVPAGAERRGYDQAVTKWEKTKIQLMGAGSALRRVESWVDAMDGGDANGVFRKYMWNPISDALGKYRAAKAPLLQRFLEIVKPIESSIASGKIEAGELNYTFSNKGELLHALLHTGNESNFQKLLRGRGWGDYADDGTLDTSKWDEFVRRMQRDGVLTKTDYDAVQQIWDLFESQKPAAQQAHKAMYGFYFKEIEPAGLDTPFGHYRGGYTAALVDPWIDVGAAGRAEKQSILESDNPTMWPSTGRGFTKSRIEAYAAPLALDLRLLPSHLDRVLRFSFLQPAVKDVSRIVLDGGFQRILGTLDPTVTQDMLVPWLQRSATQRSSTPTKGRGGQMVDSFFGALRKRTALNMLTLNVADTFGRLTTIFPAALKVRPDYLLSGLWQYAKAPRELSDTIAEKSKFMETRTSKQAAQLMGDVNEILLNPSSYDKFKDFAEKHGHFLQGGMHNLLDHVVWQGAYDQSAAAGMGEVDAVRAADSAVRLTQGSYNPEDISRLEGSSQFTKTFTMFFGYFNNQAQMLGNELRFARDLGLAKGAGRALYVYSLGLMLPAVTRELIYRAIGATDSKEDDSYMDTFLDVFFGSQARLITAMVPGGSVAQAALNVWNRKPYDDRISTSPAVSAIESAVRSPKSVYEAILKGTGSKKAIRDVLTLVGLLGVVPGAGAAARPLGYLADVEEGKAQPESELDFARGLVSGRTPSR
jgi:hypothetical protein